MWRVGLTFDLWPTDLTIKRDHPLIKDYLPTKFEASGAKRSWVISCTLWSRLAWHLTLTFDLLTWMSIGIIYSSKTIYLPSLKLQGQSVPELSVAQGLRVWHDLWHSDLTVNRDHLLIKDYRIGGNFRENLIFAIFASDLKTRKYLSAKNCTWKKSLNVGTGMIFCCIPCLI